MNRIHEFLAHWGPYLWKAVGETFEMVSISLGFSILFALPLAVLLVITRPGRAWENRWVHGGLNMVINLIRSIPFIILLFFVLPFTRFIVGTSIGVRGAVVPLIVYTAPYLARLVETALLEVDRGVLEAYEAMGIRTRDVVLRVMVREARPALVLGLTIAVIGLIGATAMAGLVGAGGLGDLAYRFGHLRFEADVMYVTLAILIVLVQTLQSLGNRAAARLRKD